MKAEVRDVWVDSTGAAYKVLSIDANKLASFTHGTLGRYEFRGFDMTKSDLREVARVCLRAAREMK